MSRLRTAVKLLVLMGSVATLMAQPLIPFEHTASLFVLEHGCGCILEITPAGDVSVGYLLVQHMVLGHRLCLRELLLEFGNNAVGEFAGAGEVSLPLALFEFKSGRVEFLFQRLRAGQLFLLGTPTFGELA